MSLPVADPQAGNVGQFFDQEAAIGPEAGEASGESLGADGIEPQGQLPDKYYNQHTLPDNVEAARVPGMFLFLTLQHTDGTWVQAVAYDPYVKESLNGGAIRWYRKKGLPYYEHFSDSSTTKTEWEMGPEYYIGIFGGPENPNRAPATHDWPYAKTGSSIANGVNIAFWAKDNNLRGLFTSAPRTLFNKKSGKTYVMPIKDGDRKNFLSEGDAEHKYLESAQIDFYATWNET